MHNLEDIVDKMRAVGEQLIPYNQLGDNSIEDVLHIAKTKETYADGYSIIIHYSKSDLKTHYLECIQILGKETPFIPFHLIAKIAKKFLGYYDLSLVEQLRDNRKIYCWTAFIDKKGRPIKPVNVPEIEICNYEGFEYMYMEPRHVDFY